MREKTMKELFIEYYKFRNKVEPKGELLDLFLNSPLSQAVSAINHSS